MSALYLGLDVGTQGTKGLIFDAERGVVVARAARPHESIAGLPPGAVEQHPDGWIEAVRAVAADLLASAGVAADAVAGVGVSGQQHGLVVLDRAQRVVRPAKLWCDTSTAAEAAELSERLGRPVPAGFTGSKVTWLARHEPRSWARTATVLLPHDYVNLRLTGEATAEAGDASGTGFFDVVARRWDDAAAAAVDERLPERLPRLVAAGEPAGVLSRDGAALLGLPPGTLVSAGGGDNMCAAIGAGATRPGVLAISLGTSGTAFAHASRPVVDAEGRIAGFCDSTGGWLPLLCVMNLTGVTEEVRAAFARDDRPAGLDELTRAAATVSPGCDGLLWLPYLAGERVPDLPRATGTLLGMRPGHLRPGVLFRAAIEGTTLNLAWGIERLAALGVAADEVRLVGGAANNPLWRAILADVLGVRVVGLVESEAAALGAALQALWTHRRTRGDRGRDGSALGAHEAVASHARLAPGVTEPDAARAAIYGDLRVRFVAEVARVYGGRAESPS